MPAVKIAISMEEPLLSRVDALAAELDLPRSQLLARGAEEVLRKHENEQLLARLNQVYGDAAPTSEEEEVRAAHRDRQRRRVQEEGR